MVTQSLLLSIAKPVGGLLLGGVILWQVVEHSGATNGRAIVHVSRAGVEVTVDEAPYRIESLDETPIVCELPPGRHLVQMRRDGRVLYREEFSVGRGEEVILAAWDGYVDGRSPCRDD